MIAAKTKLFHEDLQRKARLFKVLSHPARLQILLYLARSRNCLSGDISEMFPIKRTTVNQHIKELREAGLIEEQLSESKNVYCLNIPEHSTINIKAKSRLNCCATMPADKSNDITDETHMYCMHKHLCI
jgi:DNA-binding transcriptional ArsR family regulator